MKPATEAVLYVDGCMRNSWREWARVSRSMAASTAPASATTRPGAIDFTVFISARLRTTPPDSGIAWP